MAGLLPKMAAPVSGAPGFEGITALVAGGASGLGLSTAIRLWKNGANVIVADLPRAEKSFSDHIASSIFQRDQAITNQLKFLPADVTKEEDIARAIKAVEDYGFHPLRIAVTCAGIGFAAKLVASKTKKAHSLEDFQRVLTVNAVGTFNVMRLAAESMANNSPNENGERGVIINTSSVAAFDGQAGQCAYAAAKGAVAALTLPAARDLAPLGVRVLAVAPGLFLTPLLEGLPPKVRAELGALAPFPARLGRPEEFAHLVEAIILNPMLNGEVIRLDGAIRMPP